MCGSSTREKEEREAEHLYENALLVISPVELHLTHSQETLSSLERTNPVS